MIAPLHRMPRVSTRSIAYLGGESKFLPSLLMKEGLNSLLTPSANKETDETQSAPEADSAATKPSTDRTLLAHFSIDRNLVCIKCSLAIPKFAEFDRSIRLDLRFPSYDPTVAPSSIIQQLAEHQFPEPSRVSDLVHVMWRTFCSNDFLRLHVEAKIHTDGSMSFPRCSANVDESATHRQPEIFQNVTRREDPDEWEAEKSLLVYRMYFPSSGSNIE
jgi:hypothetical protein